MNAYCAPPSRPGPLYFAETSYGKLGIEFQALDRDINSRAEIVRQIRGGADVIKVLEVDEQDGTCRDVTDDILAEAAEAREVPSHDELQEKLRGMLIDHERDLRKVNVFGW